MGEGFGFMRGYRQAGHSILAHSRPDKIGTPRLLPLDLYKYFVGLSAKKSAQIPCPACFNWINPEGK